MLVYAFNVPRVTNTVMVVGFAGRRNTLFAMAVDVLAVADRTSMAYLGVKYSGSRYTWLQPMIYTDGQGIFSIARLLSNKWCTTWCVTFRREDTAADTGSSQGRYKKNKRTGNCQGLAGLSAASRSGFIFLKYFPSYYIINAN